MSTVTFTYVLLARYYIYGIIVIQLISHLVASHWDISSKSDRYFEKRKAVEIAEIFHQPDSNDAATLPPPLKILPSAEFTNILVHLPHAQIDTPHRPTRDKG